MSRLPTGLPVPRTGIPRSGAFQYARPSAGPIGPAPQAHNYLARMPEPPSMLVHSRLNNQEPAGMRPPSAGSLRYGSQTSSRTPMRPSTAETKQVQTRTKVVVTKPTGQKTSVQKIDKASVPKPIPSSSKAKIGSAIGPRRSAAVVPIPPPSILRKQVALQVRGAAAKAPMGSKITAVAAKKTRVAPLENIMTPAGPQQIIRKTVTEKRVERSKHGEVVSRNIKTIEADPCTGETVQIEEEVQKLNPDYPAPKGPVKQIITVVSENDVTASYETRKENVVQETITLDSEIGMDPIRVAQLVEEEQEDAQNVLKYVPPDLVNQRPELYPLRKRLHTLRLSPENTALLEQSLMSPPVTADDAIAEASPELMATVMNTSDRGGMPAAPPAQIFNSLFKSEPKDDPVMVVSSATPGPLGDIVVPTMIPEEIHEAMLSKGMEEISVIVQVGAKKPPDNSFAKAKPAQAKKKVRRKRIYRPIEDEGPPWARDDLDAVIEATGARPRNSLHPSDIMETTQQGNLIHEMVKGIEYLLDANPLQYYSRVQLRGSQPPPWFPGYMIALSDMSGSVEIAKSPSQVLYSAWRSVQPDIFPDDSIVYN